MIGFFYMSVCLLYVDYDYVFLFDFYMFCILIEKKGGIEYNIRF